MQPPDIAAVGPTDMPATDQPATDQPTPDQPDQSDANEAETVGGDVLRFGAVERAVHWGNASLFLFLLGSGFTLYGFPGTRFIGHRAIVDNLHAWAGYMLPLPLVLGAATKAGRQFREDLQRFSRWTDDDKLWWRKRTRGAAKLGKFNPGQKLNAAFIGACVVVFLATGIVIRWHEHFPLWQRSGADFTHRWLAFALMAVTIGHVLMALGRPEAMRGIIKGRVRARWAIREHPRWYAEVAGISQPVRAPSSRIVDEPTQTIWEPADPA